jgi:acyl carrier protein
MPTANNLRIRVYDVIKSLIEDKAQEVNDDTPLIGGESQLDSMKLVELCLALEDMAMAVGFEFDWTSDAAMSKSRSMFRTAASLATEFLSQMDTKITSI